MYVLMVCNNECDLFDAEYVSYNSWHLFPCTDEQRYSAIPQTGTIGFEVEQSKTGLLDLSNVLHTCMEEEVMLKHTITLNP